MTDDTAGKPELPRSGGRRRYDPPKPVKGSGRRTYDKWVIVPQENWYRDFWLFAISVVLAITAYAAVRSSTHADDLARRTHQDEIRRVQDLRDACWNSSLARTTDVNLNWIYYLSEKQLASPTPPNPKLIVLFHDLPASVQAYVLASEDGRGTPHGALVARARADYAAARAKAVSIDYRQLALIQRHTPLGSGAIPRAWVVKAHFSCRALYR